MIDLAGIQPLSNLQRNKLLAEWELVEAIRSIGTGLEQARRGEGRPMRKFVEELAKVHGVPLKKRWSSENKERESE
jgi:hypothetical protein